MKRLACVCLVGLCFFAAAPAWAVVIKTSDGNGADTELREEESSTRGGAKDLNMRVSTSPPSLDIIALRFDLSGVDRALIKKRAIETIVNRTGMPSTAVYDVYGLNADSSGQNWIEGTANGVWNAANPFPGLIYDGDVATSPLDASKTTFVGEAYWSGPTPSLGETVTFNDSNSSYSPLNLTKLLRDSGDLVTLFMSSAYSTNNTQVRFASKETVTLGQTGTSQPFGTGEIAPRLVFDIGQATRVYEWEYIDPSNPGLGKQQSSTLCPDGYFLEEVNFTAPSRNLTKAYLHGANLRQASLYSTNLTDADISQADMSNATLTSANLTGADLSQSNLSQTYLSNANLTGVNLHQANLSSAYLDSANLSGANLSQANLASANLSLATLTNADLTGADVRRELCHIQRNGYWYHCGSALLHCQLPNARFDRRQFLRQQS